MAAKKNVTMKDVAKLAGVSQPTVSYALSGSAKISDEVKGRVFAAVEQLNYKPHVYNRVTNTDSSREIAIVLPDILNPYYAQLSERLRVSLQEKKMQVLIYPTGYNAQTEERITSTLLQHGFYGVIVTYQFTNSKCWHQLKNSTMKVLAMEGGAPCEQLDIMNIRVDDHLGGYMATRFLLNKGRRKIAFVQQDTKVDAIRARALGYKEAMSELKLYNPVNIFYIQTDNNKWVEGRHVGRALLENGYDGIITTADILAVGMMNELRKNGIQIPEDVSVVGYDNVPFAELVTPALTTMTKPLTEMCANAVEYLTGTEKSNGPIVLQPALFIRDSA